MHSTLRKAPARKVDTRVRAPETFTLIKPARAEDFAATLGALLEANAPDTRAWNRAARPMPQRLG
ncbi:hypothetical protein [Streptomyces dubilierae]|uniref:DUF1778 domain-containing protein n=1 Tax=Streptomyces dubilierae TaxID=3075533 RepID=A0ABU2PKB1_9ACTN|nr:hypothetical protein [Streptomyces sp. DSM 41921]MDT0392119.1 hypothetical protein [Streptomyces sp. DSM 41921]